MSRKKDGFLNQNRQWNWNNKCNSNLMHKYKMSKHTCQRRWYIDCYIFSPKGKK